MVHYFRYFGGPGTEELLFGSKSLFFKEYALNRTGVLIMVEGIFLNYAHLEALGSIDTQDLKCSSFLGSIV